ncbi:type I restriction-modification system subunit M [Virgibacillus dakarensis]|uniref:type I restriction-modification system subunit M n=1 Tax=Virgibacillus dakarensis TaxID=1917889 RepID=UPI000B432826|nr:class I SAM-dependent DNA methyltransferase [Virgibacillus dakarensis]
MNNININQIISYIWGIADDYLRDVLVRGKYRDVILPMTVIRRIDALLEPTKGEVEKVHQFLNEKGMVNQDAALQKASGYVFYNTSKFTLRRLLDEPSQIRENFETYIAGFSPNVREIVQKFKFHNQLETLEEANVLFKLIERYTDPDLKLENLTNLDMGYVFEELIRKFNEENNEEAGEHFTPRDVVALMTHLMFEPIADKIESSDYLIYDGACGTGGMLTESQNFLKELAANKGKKINLGLYGQEVQPETYAICKSDMMIKGNSPENIKYGSTLSNDHFPDMKFDFMIMNPPYGKSWKVDKDALTDPISKNIEDPRFEMGVPRANDGQLLFMVNMLSKMKESTEMGSRIATIHNGSALFTGDAGQGESEIRKWIIENDYLEAIIALPENMFYNTDISTYIWILTNRKPAHRKGKIQLIDATSLYLKMKKSLGKKSYELTDEHIKRITEIYTSFENEGKSKLFNNEDFGLNKIVVEQPLRLSIEVTPIRINEFKKAVTDNSKKFRKIVNKEEEILDILNDILNGNISMDYNYVSKTFIEQAKKREYKFTKNEVKQVLEFFSDRDENAEKVIKKKSKNSVEYEPDTELRDFEYVPLSEDIDTYFEREVLPFKHDAWIDYSKTVKGYEIIFTKHFYNYDKLRELDEIIRDLHEIEENSKGLLHLIKREVQPD